MTTLRKQKPFVYVFMNILLFFFLCERGMAAQDWVTTNGLAVTVYGTMLNGNDLTETLSAQAKYEDSYLLALALSKKFYTYKQYIDLEFETNIAKHFGEQGHWEFNNLVVARWLVFPWDDSLDTSLAMGQGLSYATETPELEARYHDETSQYLVFSAYELAFSLPEVPHWGLILRIHHRSGAYGLFNGVHGASNSVGFGLRYAF